VIAGRNLVVQRLRQLTDRWRSEQAIEFEDRWFTWGDVGGAADALDRLLVEQAIAPHAPLTIVMRQRPGMVIAELAALRSGRTAVLLTPLQSDERLAQEIGECGAAAVVLDALDLDRPGVAAAIAAAGSLAVELGNDLVPSARPTFGESPPARRPGRRPAGIDLDAAVTVSTSGTTGPPKRLGVTWEAFAEIGGGSADLDRAPTSRRGAVIVAVPLTTLGGLLAVSRLVFGGRPMSLLERFDVHAWAGLVKRHRPKLIGAPPPVVKMILDAAITADHFEGVSAYVTSSAAVAPELIAEFEAAYGIPVLIGYGATEFLGSVTGWTVELWERFGHTKVGSAGRPHAGVRLRVVDPERGEPLPAGVPGMLEVDPPRRASGLPAGWIRTSDRARIDEDGFVWVLGRTDDVIVRGGFKVDLSEIEAVARRHPGVTDACAVAADDARLGQVPMLAVAASVAASVTATQLSEWLRRQLPPYAVPVEIKVVDAIPTTITLKPDRARVRAMMRVERLEPGTHATTRPGAPAVIMGDSGETVTYAELDLRSKQFAQLLHAAGLRPGDHLAVLLENHPRYFEVYWGAQRSGLFTTPINWHLTPDEAGYIVDDCGASAFVTSQAVAGFVDELAPHLAGVRVRLMLDGTSPGYQPYEQSIAQYPAEPLEAEVEGRFMFYSSGTTGRPKGIKPAFAPQPFGAGSGPLIMMIQRMYDFTPETVYLCPAPLYHAAPSAWSTTAQRLGATVIVMERFEPERCLELIERYKVTHAQFVPTHFVRMLKLPPEQRAAHDLSSLRVVVHAAAPCPIEIKRQMLDWWGPIIHEYYAGSEGVGFCSITPQQWLAHPGSVGVPLVGAVHILDEDGNELPPGEAGQVWFESDHTFEYHNDPAKTAEAYNERGWSSLGDIGYVDGDGYLYLTDRASHMIISGGVNIYPQEVENELVMHPAVADVAVIGVPNAEFGEEVKAVVIVADRASAGEALADELIAHCRQRLAHYKCPVSVDFVDELPRLPSGKLLKRRLREQYWVGRP
jgi:long-chain acyl-CoA synthetase